jgi:integrase
MSIYPRADGTWCVDYRDEWGTRHRKPVGTKEAAAMVEVQLRGTTSTSRRALRNLSLGEHVELTAAIEAYLAQVRSTDRTRQHMKEHLDLFTRHVGQSALAQITPRLMKEWMERRAPALSEQTLWRDVKMLRTMCEWFKEQGYTAGNPAATLQVQKPTTTSARAISYEEERRLLECLQPTTRVRCLLSLDAGLSLGEVISLRRNHLDLAAHTLTSFRHKTKRWHTVPLTARLELELREHTKASLPDSLVVSRAGRPVKERSADKFMPRACAIVGSSFRFHDLRHTQHARRA